MGRIGPAAISDWMPAMASCSSSNTFHLGGDTFQRVNAGLFRGGRGLPKGIGPPRRAAAGPEMAALNALIKSIVEGNICAQRGIIEKDRIGGCRRIISFFDQARLRVFESGGDVQRRAETDEQRTGVRREPVAQMYPQGFQVREGI